MAFIMRGYKMEFFYATRLYNEVRVEATTTWLLSQFLLNCVHLYTKWRQSEQLLHVSDACELPVTDCDGCWIAYCTMLLDVLRDNKSLIRDSASHKKQIDQHKDR